jgi:hypothetical protein
MEARIGKLETDIEYIKRDIGEVKAEVRESRLHQERDFRLLFGTIVFVAVGLGGIMAKGFGWLH